MSYVVAEWTDSSQQFECSDYGENGQASVVRALSVAPRGILGAAVSQPCLILAVTIARAHSTVLTP